MSKRKDFDTTAQCGYLSCEECGELWYPMEVEDGECPDCMGKCTPFVQTKREPYWTIRRQLFISKHSFITQVLGEDGEWYIASNAARKFTSKPTGLEPGQYAEKH